MDATTAPVESASVAEAASSAPPFTGQLVNLVDQLRQGQIPEPLIALVIKSGVALLMIVVTYFVASFLTRMVSAAICKRVDTTLGRFSGKMTFYGTWIIALTFLLPWIGLEVAGLAAILAAAGFAIGLSFQGTLSNFAAGILLLVFRPFKAGDLIMTAGITGKVYEIDLFTTILDTFDNRRLIIPNSSITGASIENMSYHPQRRVDVTVGVAYSASLDDTRMVLTQSAESLRFLMAEGEGRGYQIVLTNLAASAVEWTVRFWTNKENFFEAKEKLTAEIKRRLDENKIQIPFPQMQLHISQPAAAEGLEFSESTMTQATFPIPSMPGNSTAARSGRVRPRARGDNLGVN